MFPSHISWALTLSKFFKPHAHTHHIVIIVIVDIDAVLTLCYSKMSHATLIFFYHTTILTLQNSLMPRALWLPQARFIVYLNVLH